MLPLPVLFKSLYIFRLIHSFAPNYKSSVITIVLDLRLHRLVALRSTCLVTCPLRSSLESSEIHFVRQQPTEPSDCQVAT